MRKTNIFFIIFILATAVYAQEQVRLNLAGQTYSPGETVQLEILTQDPEVEPSASDLELFDSNSNEIRVAPLLTKIMKNNYYAYFDLPDFLTAGEYKIALSDLRFKINDTLREVSSEIKFNVEVSKPTLSIKPALFLVNKDTRELQLQITNKDFTTQISFLTSDFIKHPYERQETLAGLTSRKFYFNLENITQDTQGFINLSYENKSYSLPIFVFTGLQTKVETEASLPVESVEETTVQPAETRIEPALTEPTQAEPEEELFKLPPPVPVITEPESKLGLYLTIFVIVVIAAIIYKLTKKEKQKKTFKEYISKLKR